MLFLFTVSRRRRLISMRFHAKPVLGSLRDASRSSRCCVVRSRQELDPFRCVPHMRTHVKACQICSGQYDKDRPQRLYTVCAILWIARCVQLYEMVRHGEQSVSDAGGMHPRARIRDASMQVRAISASRLTVLPCDASSTIGCGQLCGCTREGLWAPCGQKCVQLRTGTSEWTVPLRVDRGLESPCVRVAPRSAPGPELRIDDVLRLRSLAAELEVPRPMQRDLVPLEIAAGELRQHQPRAVVATIDGAAGAEAQPGGQYVDAPAREQVLRRILDQEHLDG